MLDKDSDDEITSRQAHMLAMGVISRLTKVSSDESAMMVSFESSDMKMK